MEKKDLVFHLNQKTVSVKYERDYWIVYIEQLTVQKLGQSSNPEILNHMLTP